jgi:hypothetical protein
MWQIKGSTWSYCLQTCTYDNFQSLINSPRFVRIQILVSVDTLCLFICCPPLLFLKFLSPRKKWFELIGTTCFVYFNNNFIWSYWVLFLSINYGFENFVYFWHCHHRGASTSATSMVVAPKKHFLYITNDRLCQSTPLLSEALLVLSCVHCTNPLGVVCHLAQLPLSC